jgi:hypothetical protein
MWRLIKFLVYLAILTGIVLVLYAYVGPILLPDHFVPATGEIVTPVDLDLD